jgi:thioredoxin 1
MLSRVYKISLLAATLVASPIVASIVARAGEPFDAKAFQSAQNAEKAILVDITASWCPTCRQQRPIVQQIEKERQDLIVYDVDFDTAKDLLKRFHVQYQSTLIVFRGPKEVARSTGETDPAVIRSLIAKAF